MVSEAHQRAQKQIVQFFLAILFLGVDGAGGGGGKRKLFGSEEFTFNLLYLKKKSFRLPPRPVPTNNMAKKNWTIDFRAR